MPNENVPGIVVVIGRQWRAMREAERVVLAEVVRELRGGLLVVVTRRAQSAHARMASTVLQVPSAVVGLTQVTTMRIGEVRKNPF